VQQVGVLLERLGQRRVLGQRLRMGYRRLERGTCEWEPFRPVALDPAWLKPNVASLAQADEERLLPSGALDVARLAVLADALEEAGCADDAILSHLRSPDPHVRGCWALDLILDKG
jgi:hypothetical protein